MRPEILLPVALLVVIANVPVIKYVAAVPMIFLGLRLTWWSLFVHGEIDSAAFGLGLAAVMAACLRYGGVHGILRRLWTGRPTKLPQECAGQTVLGRS
jgi:hypothetical protein